MHDFANDASGKVAPYGVLPSLIFRNEIARRKRSPRSGHGVYPAPEFDLLGEQKSAGCAIFGGLF